MANELTYKLGMLREALAMSFPLMRAANPKMEQSDSFNPWLFPVLISQLSSALCQGDPIASANLMEVVSELAPGDFLACDRSFDDVLSMMDDVIARAEEYTS